MCLKIKITNFNLLNSLMIIQLYPLEPDIILKYLVKYYSIKYLTP